MLAQIHEIKKAVIYYRLSRKKKGRNKEETKDEALGIQAQRDLVEMTLARFSPKVVREFTEIETGTKKKYRAVLAEAIATCKLHKATLVIANVGRLARNLAFTATMLESNLPFICCDDPTATHLTIQFKAIMAEQEARDISDRTIRALKAAKDKGTKLGSQRPGHWEGREHLRGWKQAAKASGDKRAKHTQEAYSFIIRHMHEWRDEGMSLAQIANKLNELGHQTTWGKPFGVWSVDRLLKRYPKIDELQTV